MAKKKRPAKPVKLSNFHSVRKVRNGYSVIRGRGRGAKIRAFTHIGTVIRRKENAEMLAYWLSQP